MRKKLQAVIYVLFCTHFATAQNFPGIAEYATITYPSHGVKIKTNLPFTNSSQMPTISIVGYSYGLKSTIDLKISYYIFGGAFVNYGISSAGSYAPNVQLGVENNKVVIFIDDKVYFQRFIVDAFSKQVHPSVPHDPAWFQGWTVADEALAATHVTPLPYQNKFGDNINFTNGNIGLGTATIPAGYKLAVAGKVIAEELKVKPSVNWPDYVFDTGYALQPIAELEKFIKLNKHLPDIPTAQQVNEEGLEIGSNQAALLKKLEEQTLYIIEQNRKLELLEKRLAQLEELQLSSRKQNRQSGK